MIFLTTIPGAYMLIMGILGAQVFGVGETAGVFERGVEHAMTHVESLAHCHLFGIGIGSQADLPWRVSALGVDLDNAIAQVAIFDRWYAGHDLDAGHVGRADGACADSIGLAHLGIVLQPLSVDLDGWTASSLEDASWTFGGCESLESLDLSGWDAPKLARAARAFSHCTSLESLDLGGLSRPETMRLLESQSAFAADAAGRHAIPVLAGAAAKER